MYPLTPGFKEKGDCSEEAAERIEPCANIILGQVLAALRENDLTADECAEALSITPFSCRPAISRLRALGFVRKSGLRRENVSGMRAAVWTTKPALPEERAS